jgi:hypothetical protein
MNRYWIGILLTALTGATILLSVPLTNPQKGNADAPPDVWGGNHASMRVTLQGANLEFDCAHGSILEPIKANAKGEFVARGTYTPEHGGPITPDNSPRDLPATYKGTIEGNTMRLDVTPDDKHQTPEPFTLTRGKAGRVVKCR